MIPAPAIPISGECKKSVVADKMDLTASQRVSLTSNRQGGYPFSFVNRFRKIGDIPRNQV